MIRQHKKDITILIDNTLYEETIDRITKQSKFLKRKGKVLPSCFVNTLLFIRLSIWSIKQDLRMNTITGLNPATNNFAGAPIRTHDYHEAISYDPNGNIKTYLPNGDSSSRAMDKLG